jgi:hypothetical protein
MDFMINSGKTTIKRDNNKPKNVGIKCRQYRHVNCQRVGEVKPTTYSQSATGCNKKQGKDINMA